MRITERWRESVAYHNPEPSAAGGANDPKENLLRWDPGSSDSAI